MACAVRSGPKQRAGTCVGLVQSSSLIGSFALLWLPSLLVLIPGSTANGRAFIGAALFALLLGIAPVSSTQLTLPTILRVFTSRRTATWSTHTTPTSTQYTRTEAMY